VSDLSTMIKRFILPVIFASVAFQIPVQANTVRILGPAADEQPATIVGVSQDSTQNRSSATRYGPTANSETLWSIASRNRPNNQVSVYQVIGAIHRANPQAFEQNNIHGLLPGSVLTIPGLAQIRQENVDSVKRRLAADQQRQSRQASTSAPARAPAPKVNKQEPTVVAQPLPKPDVAKEEVVSQSVATSQSTRGGIPLKPTALQEQLDASDVQMTKLLESNHLLRVRLAEMQHEVTALRDQVSSDDVLRDQIKGFIEQQKAQPIEPVVAETSWLDSLIANPWALAAVAFVPGSLIAGLLAFFMLRRKKDDADDVKSLDSPEQKPAMVPPPADSDDAIPDLALSDDSGLDDLFGGDDESLFDDPEKSLFPSETDKSSDSIDMLDLSVDSDEFEIDSGLTPSSISVKGDEQAIGLQDMERALDEMEQSTEQSSDEALAAMWEQSLQSESDDEESFDLSDDSLSSLDDDLLDEQKIEDGLLDQSILDDLLSEVDMEQESQAQAVEEDASQQVVDQDELDSLFDMAGGADVAEPAVDTVQEAVQEAVEETEELAQQAAIDQALAEADAMFAVETEAVDEGDVDEDDIDALFEANSTALLDDLIEDDELSSDIEVEENSTALLDELLEDGGTKDVLNPKVSIDENSTALLDELVDDLDTELVDQDSYGSVVPGAVIEDDESPSIDDVVIDENSTDLLDDILAQYGSHPDFEPKTETETETETEPEVSTAESEIQEPEPEALSTDFSDPEFEPASDSEVASSQQSQSQSQSEPDADFPESEQSAFAEIFNDVLDDQSSVADSEPEQTEEPTSEPQAELIQEPEEIDALLADVEGLLDEPDVDDVDNLERSVDELLDSIEHQPEQPVHADDNAQAEADLEQAILSGAGYDDLPVSDEEVVLAEPESLSAEEALDISQSVEESPEFLSVEDPLQEETPQVEEPSATESSAEEPLATEPSVEESLEERLPEAEVPEDLALAEQQLESVAPESVTDDAVEPLSLDDSPETTLAVDEPLDALTPEVVLEEDALLEEQPLVEESLVDGSQEERLPEPVADDAVEPLSLDDLPEFDEEAAFNDPEAEALEEMQSLLSDDEEQVALDNIVKQLQQAAEAAQPVEALPEASLPVAESLEEQLSETEFSEEPTATELPSEPEISEPVNLEPVAPESVAGDAVEPLSLDDLPEFDEEAAFNDPEAEAPEEMLSPLSDDEEQVAFDNIVKQVQQAAEAAQPESAALATEPASLAPASIHGEQQIAFESIDPDSLPEFSEDEALQASFDEQHELEQYEVEQGLKEPQTAKAEQPSISPAMSPADMFDDELVDSAGLDMAALLSDPEEIFADEGGVIADSMPEAPPVEPQALKEEHSAYDTESEEAAVIEPERDAVIESESVAESLQQDVASEDVREPGQPEPIEHGFDKADDIVPNTHLGFQDELEAEREQLLSDSFEGDEQFSGFTGSDLEMPEEDSEIWAQTSPEPVLESENWADQPQMLIEDVAAFDTEMLLAEAESQALLQDVAGSELVDEPSSPSYISIDELMKDLEPETPIELDDEPLNLEVGLDEFPDVLSDVAAFDVDSQGEYASKLDLAKAYLEMNDSEGALSLLEEVASNGDAQIKREAKGLLEKIGVRRS